MNIVFDIHPWDDPRDGAALVRLTAGDQLLDGSGLRVEKFGLGSGILVVNRNHPDVTHANFAVGNYVRVYDIDVSADIPIFGFFLEERFYQVLSVDESGGEIQRHGGQGIMSYFGRAFWDNTNYVNFGNDAQFGPRSDGYWYWYNDQYGDILKRAIDEAQDPDRPGYATLIPDLTYDWDSTNDSAGDPWVSFSGDWKQRVGTNYLNTLQAMQDEGLFVRMSPDFLMQAFQSDPSFDRTTSDFASGKVLFVSYRVAGNDANIVNQLPRSKREALQATRVLVKGSSDDPTTMRHRTLAGNVGREIFVEVESSSTSVMDAAGDRALAAREDGTDVPTFKHIPGTDALAGLYTPFPPETPLPELLLPRLYFTGTLDGTAVAIDGDWDVNRVGGGSGSKNLLKTTASPDMVISADNWSTLPKNVCGLQHKYVLTGPVDFTGGQVRAQIGVKAKSGIGIGAQGHYSQMSIRLFDSSDVLIGQLLSIYSPGSPDSTRWSDEGTEGPSPPVRNAMFPMDSQWTDQFGAPLEGSLSGDVGDYLIVETGSRHMSGQDGPGAGFGMHHDAGDVEGDYTAGDQTETGTRQSWIEFWGPAESESASYQYWVGDLVTIATGSAVGDYDYENKRVYAINWVLDDSATWWPMPELGPISSDDQMRAGGLVASSSAGGGAGGGGSTTTAPATLVKKQLTNESGQAVARGDVVVVDPSNDESFDVTSTPGETRMVGVAMEDVLDGLLGWVALHGYVDLVTVAGSVTRGHYGLTSSTPTEAGTSVARVEGTFCQFLTDGTLPSAWLFGAPDPAVGGGVSEVVSHGDMGATETFDFEAGTDHEGNLDDDLIVSLVGATTGEAAWLTLALTDDGGGPYTLSWPASVVWPGDVEPDPPDAGETLVVTLFSYDGGVNWYGSYPGTGAGGGGTSTFFTVDPGTPTYDDTSGDVVVTVVALFGIDGNGDPYYNEAGVTSGEEAALMRESANGTYFLRPYNF